MLQMRLIKDLWAENRGRLCLVIILCVLLATLQLWQGVWFAPKITATRLELSRLQTELRQARQQELVGGGAVVTSLADDVENFYQMVPPISGLGSFIGRLYSYAESAGIDIRQITYTTKPVENLKLQQYVLSFAVMGRYTQIKKFVHLLENSASLLVLDKIALVGTRQDAQDVVNLQLQLQTFFREEGA